MVCSMFTSLPLHLLFAPALLSLFGAAFIVEPEVKTTPKAPLNWTDPTCEPSLTSPWKTALEDGINYLSTNMSGKSCANTVDGGCTLLWDDGHLPAPAPNELGTCTCPQFLSYSPLLARDVRLSRHPPAPFPHTHTHKSTEHPKSSQDRSADPPPTAAWPAGWTQRTPSSARIYLCGPTDETFHCEEAGNAVANITNDPSCSIIAPMM